MRELSKNDRGDIHSKHIANSKLDGKKLQLLPIKSGTRYDYPHYTYSI